MRIIKMLLLGCCIILFSGCDSVSHMNRSTAYKDINDTNAKPIVVPKGLSSSKIETYYKVPAVRNSAPKNVSILPPGLTK